MGEGYLSSRRNNRKSRGKLSLLLFGFRLVFASSTPPPPPAQLFPSIKKEKENHSQRITGSTEYNSFAWKFERCP